MFLLISLMAILGGCYENRNERIERLDREAELEFSRRNYEQAVQLWTEASQEERDRSALSLKLGKAYERLGKFDLAEKAYRLVIQQNPEVWDAWLEIGKLKLLWYDLDSAEDIWRHLENNKVNFSRTYLFHGDLMMLKNEFYRAELDYRQALDQRPDLVEAKIHLAISLVSQNKKQPAQEIYASIDQSTLVDTDTLFKLANYNRLISKPDVAEELILSAISQEPEDLRYLLYASDFYHKIGKLESSLEYIKKIVLLGTDDTGIKKRYASLLLDLQMLDEAFTVLNDLEKDNPDDNFLPLLMGRYHLLRGEYVIAISYLKRATDYDKKIPSAHYYLGIAYLSNGLNQLGLNSLMNALVLSPEYSDAEIMLAGFYHCIGDYEKSLTHATRLLQRSKEFYRAQLITGANHLALDNFDDAYKAFQLAGESNPKHPAYRYYLALTLELSGKTKQALCAYRELLKDSPLLIDVLLRFRNLASSFDQLQEVEEQLQYASEVAEHSGQFYLLLGEFYLQQDEIERSIQMLIKAVSSMPDLKLPYLLLYKIYQNQNDTQSMFQILNQAIERISDFSEAYLRLAEAYINQKAHGRAIEVLQHAHSMDPNNVWLANSLAALYLHNDIELIKAFELARYVYEIDPENPAFSDTLGWAFYKKGIYLQAIWYLQHAEEHSEKTNRTNSRSSSPLKSADAAKEFAIIKFHLGMALMKNDEVRKGRQKLKESIGFGLDGEYLAEAQQILGKE